MAPDDLPPDDRAPDEDLPASAAWSPRRRRLMIALGGVLVIALAAVAVVRIATHSAPRAAPATVTVAPSSRSPVSSRSPASGATATAPGRTHPPGLTKPLDVLHGLNQLSTGAISSAHANCPRLAPTCTTTGETPAAVTTALHAAFPKVHHLVAVSDIAYSDSSGPRLTYRLLTARAGRRTIVIEVRATQSGDGAGSQQINEGNDLVYRTQTVVDGLTIELQLTVPPRTYVYVGPMRKFVDDLRLRAIG